MRPRRGMRGPRDARSSRLVINLVAREVSFDAPSPKRRDEVAKSVGLPRTPEIEASGVKSMMAPSKSFVDEIHSDDPLGSDLEGLGEDLDAFPMGGGESGAYLESVGDGQSGLSV